MSLTKPKSLTTFCSLWTSAQWSRWLNWTSRRPSTLWIIKSWANNLSVILQYVKSYYNGLTDTCWIDCSLFEFDHPRRQLPLSHLSPGGFYPWDRQVLGDSQSSLRHSTIAHSWLQQHYMFKTHLKSHLLCRDFGTDWFLLLQTHSGCNTNNELQI